MADGTIGILLFRCGPWMVGVDPLSVVSIRPIAEEDDAVDVGTFMRGVPSAPEEGDKPRLVEVSARGVSMKLRVDHAVGTQSLTLTELRPLPPVLEHYGAPPWWIGTTVIDDSLVLLLDIERLATATGRHT